MSDGDTAAGPEYYLGLISGTSVDAIDCVVGDFSSPQPQLMASHSEPVPASLRDSLIAHCSPSATTLPALGQLDVEVGRLFAKAAIALLDREQLPASSIHAIGCHGQTVYHSPDTPFPFTLQIGDPSTIALRTGIATVADFRRMDMAAGGQGAPLAPLFHQAAFSRPGQQRAVLNLGGIANLTLLTATGTGPVSGFDTGPASGLMDSWIKRCQGEPFDREGRWAASGSINAGLLGHMLSDPYFHRLPPKSTGREYFSPAWLDRHIRESGAADERPENIQATLLELTARSIAEALQRHAQDVEILIVCGGGVYNRALMERLERLLPDLRLQISDELGIAADWVEAMTFAWLAQRRLRGEAVDCRHLTGARAPCLLGGVYLPPGRTASAW